MQIVIRPIVKIHLQLVITMNWMVKKLLFSCLMFPSKENICYRLCMINNYKFINEYIIEWGEKGEVDL